MLHFAYMLQSIRDNQTIRVQPSDHAEYVHLIYSWTFCKTPFLKDPSAVLVQPGKLLWYSLGQTSSPFGESSNTPSCILPQSTGTEWILLL